MGFGMILLNQSIRTTQVYDTWIKIAYSKNKIVMFIKTLQIMISKDCYV